MACSTCKGDELVCKICDRAKFDCNCTEDDIADYIEAEEIEAEGFDRFEDCDECM